ncbi:MAG: class I SAM-dependent methyltransferase [Parvibaculaceae bacterium]
MSDTPLSRIIAADIRENGPMPLDRYMALCLGHPAHGYYMTRDPFGSEGDFITAPEISQMFGELIGIWCVTVFQAMGAPRPFNLVELGPGRGTLMADLLRAASKVPEFGQSAALHLVETSPVLRRIQRRTLGDAPRWHDSFASVPEGPMILIANEFFDALPVRQFECRDGKWFERCVGLSAGGRLVIGLSQTIEPLPPAPDGAIIETAPDRLAMAHEIALRLSKAPGNALVIDYGHAASGRGDTLQAVRKHEFTGLLDAAGEADITAHVDFEALGSAFRQEGARVHGPITQGEFLKSLGVELRASRLGDEARLAAERLADEGQMGNLFKVMAVTSPGLPAPYPFGVQ